MSNNRAGIDDFAEQIQIFEQPETYPLKFV
jgi:hypothetical protein